MDIKKIFGIIICISLAKVVYANAPNSFVVEPLLLPDDEITIMRESVTFSGVKISVDYELRNNLNEKTSKSLKIDCYPTNGGRWLYGPVFVPDNLRIYENGKEISFSIIFNGIEYNNFELISERTEGKSTIVIQLNFDKNEEKQVTVKYDNNAEILKYELDTGNRLVERHFFNLNSMEKKVFYIPDDKNLNEYEGFALFDFLIKNETGYCVTDYCRKYDEKTFVWFLQVPDNIDEIICRQDYFYPLGDFSSYALIYKEAFVDLEEPIVLRFKNKNLSKELLSKSDVFALSKKQLSILRNSFYAKYGCNFEKIEIKKYFDANCEVQGIKYKTNLNFSESVFNEIEKKNIELIRYMENKKEALFFQQVEKLETEESVDNTDFKKKEEKISDNNQLEQDDEPVGKKSSSLVLPVILICAGVLQIVIAIIVLVKKKAERQENR